MSKDTELELLKAELVAACEKVTAYYDKKYEDLHPYQRQTRTHRAAKSLLTRCLHSV